ncbi:MAG: double-strand break repair protein AddB [Pseudomonadota bacterium]
MKTSDNPPAQKGYQQPTVFSVPPGEAFLPLVAQSICDGTVLPGVSARDGPLALAKATLYVPTRRAARELRSAFVDVLPAGAALLPRIVPLGEFDEDAAFFRHGDPSNILKLPPAVSAMERQIILGSWVSAWAKALAPDAQSLLGDAPATPVSMTDAFWMARDLAALLDQMQTEEIGFAALDDVIDADISDWWKLTHTFLSVVRDQWPLVLRSLERVDPAVRRTMLLDAERSRIEASASDAPFAVIGSTGTIPATARLIETIAKRASGAVILPGYNRHMSTAVRQALESDDNLASAIGHPQFGMHRLVRTIGAGHPDLVRDLARPDMANALEARRGWVDAAMAPSSTTNHWVAARRALTPDAFEDVAILHARDAGEEALSVACALRAAILDPDVQCALVTPDRALARRVSIELTRFGIQADDSGGTPFANTPQGLLLALTLQVACDGRDPNDLLALLKHPMVHLGFDSQAYRQFADLFELIVLRGGQRRFSIGNLTAGLTSNLRALDTRSGSRRLPRSAPDLTDTLRQSLADFTEKLESHLAGFRDQLDENTPVPLSELARRTTALLEALACDSDGIIPALYAEDAGALLSDALATLCDPDLTTEVTLETWPGIVKALMAGSVVKPDYGGHPRISIWGTLEARLQHVDFMVLGGLNEGSWPAIAENDAFITRTMKHAMGMEPPERRVGLAAHDFQIAMGAPRVLLTRSGRKDGSPTVASRWLQRLETLAGGDAVKAMRETGAQHAAMATALTTTDREKPLGAPEPKPPVAQRPKRLSVTEVETLRRDPYAIYAKHVLGLRPLEPVVEEPDARLRGTLIHACAEAFVAQDIDYGAANAADRLRAIARTVFDDADLPTDIDTIWWSRMQALIPRLVEWEADRNTLVHTRHTELVAAPTPIDDTGVVLTGRGDRFDVRHDGLIDIIDIKTGVHPSLPQVQHRFAPQLPLEAALLLRGAFADLSPQIGELIYLKLGARGEVDDKVVGPVAVKADPKKNEAHLTSADLADRDWRALVKRVRSFENPQTGYASWLAPEKQNRWPGDYDHLARTAEWGSEVDVSGQDAGGDDV